MVSDHLITRVFIANRGEVACRIIRTCRNRGIETVVPFVSSERTSRAVKEAHFSYELSSTGQGFMEEEELISLCRLSGAQALHPGYGFLSEKASFAKRVTDADIIWIGPPPLAMELLGNKESARRYAQKLGISVAKGVTISRDSILDPKVIEDINSLTFPLLVKGGWGGGGRGQSLLTSKIESLFLQSILEQYSPSEPVFVEEFISPARHIEVQVVVAFDNRIFILGDRDCTVQRNNQKIIEEAPASGISTALRQELNSAALQLLKDSGYLSLATVEFLVQPSGRWIFLEVNTRLQVEHTVTEEVFGVDLVGAQLDIAQATPPFTLSDWSGKEPLPHGHAIELRICAEDPYSHYLPSSGIIDSITYPEGCRIETGIQKGDSINCLFDSLLCKVIVHAPTREKARCQSLLALKEMTLQGVITNEEFLKTLLQSTSFISDTHTLSLTSQSLPLPSVRIDHLTYAAALFLTRYLFPLAPSQNPWENLGTWSNAFSPLPKFIVSINEYSCILSVILSGICNDHFLEVSSDATETPFMKRFELQENLFIKGEKGLHTVALADNHGYGSIDDVGYQLSFQFVPLVRLESRVKPLASLSLRAPLPGKLLRVLVKVGGAIAQGQEVALLESMKMSIPLYAPCSGVVMDLHVSEGKQIKKGELLISFNDKER